MAEHRYLGAESSEQINRRTLLNGAGLVGGALLAAATLPGAADEVLAQSDQIAATRFSLRAEGAEIASFSELTGLVSEIEATVYLEGADSTVSTSKLPGKTKRPTLTLKRGLTGGMELWAWHEAVLVGNPAARKDCNLVLLGDDGKSVARYQLQNAWPSKLQIENLKAGSSQSLAESVTLTCDHVQRVAP